MILLLLIICFLINTTLSTTFENFLIDRLSQNYLKTETIIKTVFFPNQIFDEKHKKQIKIKNHAKNYLEYNNLGLIQLLQSINPSMVDQLKKEVFNKPVQSIQKISPWKQWHPINHSSATIVIYTSYKYSAESMPYLIAGLRNLFAYKNYYDIRNIEQALITSYVSERLVITEENRAQSISEKRLQQQIIEKRPQLKKVPTLLKLTLIKIITENAKDNKYCSQEYINKLPLELIYYLEKYKTVYPFNFKIMYGLDHSTLSNISLGHRIQTNNSTSSKIPQIKTIFAHDENYNNALINCINKSSYFENNSIFMYLEYIITCKFKREAFLATSLKK